ncbi:MAG: hypothetical protein LBV73_27465 [Paraburkholderia sp.]|jgi:phage FluMu protein Com|nr:hypothetical protein [Paraburkholderia sp.]
MGEYAELMLEGVLCEGCGMFIDDDAPGHPRHCDDCATDVTVAAVGAPLSRKVQCCHCARLIVRTGLKDHMDSKHPGVPHDEKTRCGVCNRSVKTVGIPQHMRALHGA